MVVGESWIEYCSEVQFNVIFVQITNMHFFTINRNTPEVLQLI